MEMAAQIGEVTFLKYHPTVPLSMSNDILLGQGGNVKHVSPPSFYDMTWVFYSREVRFYNTQQSECIIII